MKYILILLMSATGGWNINRWEQPALTTATFADRAACESAAAEVKKLESNRRLDNVRIQALCVPAASEAPKQ